LTDIGLCPPGHHHCRDEHNGSSSGGGSSGGSSYNSGTSNSNYNSNGSNNYDGSSTNAANGATTYDSSSGGSGSNSNSVEGNSSARDGTSQIMGLSVSNGWLYGIALAACVAAGVAMYVGSRKGRQGPQHPLENSIQKRMKLFSQFADSSLTTQPRASRVVEVSGDYQMQEMV
jgi:hypothetical protein